jgi:HEAT repeat protein
LRINSRNQQKPKIFFLLFLAFAMGAVDEFSRWRSNYQSPSSIMKRYLCLWQPNQMPEDGNMASLISQLDSQYPADRWAAAGALSRGGYQRAVPFLIQAMADDRGTVRTCVMAQSLGVLSDSRAVPALIETLNHPSNEDLRICTAEALGRIGDKRAIQPLIDAFQANRVRFAALRALGQIGGPYAESFLKSIAQNSSRSMDASTAKYTLEYINTGEKSDDSHYLQTQLSTAKGVTRRWIVELLARNGQVDAANMLATLLTDESEDAEIRGIAAAGLVLRGHDSLDILHRLAESRSSSTRYLAKAAIARIP